MKILLPVDGSTCSIRAAEQLLKMRSELASSPETHLLQVHLPIPIGRVQAHVGHDTLLAYYREESEAQLAAVAQLLKDAGLEYHTHIHVGQPAEVIVDIARQIGAEMILMGTHGRGAVGTLVLGSVSAKVLHFSPCPVMLVK